jgi:hypothetical protein
VWREAHETDAEWRVDERVRPIDDDARLTRSHRYKHDGKEADTGHRRR